VRHYRRMRSSPLDSTEGVRSALRSLLTVTLGPAEGGGVYLGVGPRLRLAAAAPSERVFRDAAVKALARRASLGAADVLAPPTPGIRTWASALAVPLPGREGALVLLSRRPTPETLRSRAPVLASLASTIAARRTERPEDLGGGKPDLLDRVLGLARSDPVVASLSRDVLELATALTGADVGGLWVQEAAGGPLELSAVRRARGAARPRPSLPEATLDELRRREDFRQDSGSLARGRKLLGAPKLHSILLLPVGAKDAALGILAVGRLRGERRFDPQSGDRLAKLTTLAAVPLAQATADREGEALGRSLAAARRIAQPVAEGQPLDRVLGHVSRVARTIVAFDVSAILVLDQSGSCTLLVHGRPGSTPSVLGPLPGWQSSRLGAAMLHREATIVRAIPGADRTLLPFAGSDASLRAAILMPLVANRDLFGALILGSRAPGRFRRSDLPLLGPAARVLAMALRDSRARQGMDRPPERAPAGAERRPAQYAALGRLAEVLAHEIRNPLTVIGTTIQYLRSRRLVGDEYLPLLESAVHKAREVDEALDSLLSLARPLALRLEPVPVASVLDEVAEFIRLRAADRAVDVTVKARTELIGRLDRRVLGQALLNLALNAIDAMRGGGHLTFEARRVAESGFLAITVTDTGSGIAPENLDVIFEPYYSTKLHGTGLGLAITRRIVEEHGGSIRVSSEPGNGTTFTLLLLEPR
jgi:signal transduction histidine kinase